MPKKIGLKNGKNNKAYKKNTSKLVIEDTGYL